MCQVNYLQTTVATLKLVAKTRQNIMKNPYIHQHTQTHTHMPRTHSHTHVRTLTQQKKSDRNAHRNSQHCSHRQQRRRRRRVLTTPNSVEAPPPPPSTPNALAGPAVSGKNSPVRRRMPGQKPPPLLPLRSSPAESLVSLASIHRASLLGSRSKQLRRD